MTVEKIKQSIRALAQPQLENLLKAMERSEHVLALKTCTILLGFPCPGDFGRTTCTGARYSWFHQPRLALCRQDMGARLPVFENERTALIPVGDVGFGTQDGGKTWTRDRVMPGL
jgi:hypothetical protein